MRTKWKRRVESTEVCDLSTPNMASTYVAMAGRRWREKWVPVLMAELRCGKFSGGLERLEREHREWYLYLLAAGMTRSRIGVLKLDDPRVSAVDRLLLFGSVET